MSVKITRQDGLTALHVASRGGFVDIVSLLISKNANVNVVDRVDMSLFADPNWRFVKLVYRVGWVDASNESGTARSPQDCGATN